MKVIELLNKIAKSGELPKEVIYNQEKYTYKENSYGYDYINENYGGTGLFNGWCIDKILNDEVIVIEEEKEIEKIKELPIKLFHNKQKILANKLNELIDVINDMRDKEC